jgi:hypothetical protein
MVGGPTVMTYWEWFKLTSTGLMISCGMTVAMLSVWWLAM